MKIDRNSSDATAPPESDSPVILSDDDCAAFLADLGDLNDIRQAPTAGRHRQFRTGWRDAAERGREYTADTLERLTWQNLGYRLGQKWGVRSAVEIDDVYEQFARHFSGSNRLTVPALSDLPEASQALESEGVFDPTSIEDARQRIERAIVQRQGQRKFREDLLVNYRRCCPITGCDLPAALEAAHIIPYQGEKTNDAANGLPLRADIHTLFDLYLLSIHPESRKVVIAPELQRSCYAELEGKVLAAPERGSGPAQGALEKHYREFLDRRQ